MQTRNESAAASNIMFRTMLAMRSQPGAGTTRQEYLPFRVRLVRNDADLAKAVSIRHSAYSRHVPEFASTLYAPEPFDYEDGTVVLLAESKLDGTPIGTMRIKTNRHAPLSLEQSVKLPEWLEYTSIAEATRLGVTVGRMGPIVKTVLFKAFFQYCRQVGIEWMVIAGRAPLDRQYEELLFQDVYPDAGFIPMRHAAGIPHRVLALDVVNVQSIWNEARHPLYSFIFDTAHPDIDLSGIGERLVAPEVRMPTLSPRIEPMEARFA